VVIIDIKKKETVCIYRAVGKDELKSILKTKQFSLKCGGAEVKYFGIDFNETLNFANKDLFDDDPAAAIVEVVIEKNVLEIIGDFTNVDARIFRSGTVEIQENKLFQFNSAIIGINYYI